MPARAIFYLQKTQFHYLFFLNNGIFAKNNEMLLSEISSKLNRLFKIETAEEFDNVGLLCGNPNSEITKILVCHDSLECTVDEAISKNCHLIVAFHPIIFSGLKTITGKNYVEKTVLKAMENKIAIYAVHTAFDNDFFGVNFAICNSLQLTNQKILIPKYRQLQQLSVYIPKEYSEKVKEALFSAGAGNLGFYDECSFQIPGLGTFRPQEGANPFSGQINKREESEEIMLSVIFENYKQSNILDAMQKAHPYEEIAYQITTLENKNPYEGLGKLGELDHAISEEEFLNFIKEKFQLKVIRHSSFTGKKIKKVGVLGGSGASGISRALAEKCDVYLTGDLKYHDFFRAEGKILLCDIGHFESEQFVVQQLFRIISEKFPNFAILKSEVNTNPVNYYI